MEKRLFDRSLSLANPDIDEKDSSNNNVAFDNAGSQTGTIAEDFKEEVPSSTDAETLLRALRNVIIPFVRPAEAEDKLDATQNPLGLDGEEFITALQKFMLSFLRSHRGPVGGVEVELKAEKGTETLSEASNNFSPTDIADIPSETGHLVNEYVLEGNMMTQKDSESIEAHNEESPDGGVIYNRNSINIEDADTFESRKPRFFELLRKALREHIFKNMPIRLLCFKPHNSKLQITLVERGQIYDHIYSRLENGIDFAEVWRDVAEIESDRSYNNDMSSEQDSSYDDDISSEQPVVHVINKLISKYSGYAILSHTWLRGPFAEITYGDWNWGAVNIQQPGYYKLVNFCKAAWEDYRVAFGWMDTICINKESSAELAESIRCMYKWYRNSDVCITYLADTVALSDMHKDAWFTRGWTLQELLASSYVKFYDADWNKLVDSLKSDREDAVILNQIEQATTITAHELGTPITELPISRRMQMAAKRQVTREEDGAYSLMGIFDVSIGIAYGEGAERAFSRLVQEILNSSNDVADLFNWAGPYAARTSRLLPCSSEGYLHRSPHPRLDVKKAPVEPMMLTHFGLRVTIVLMRAISIQKPTSRYDSTGDYHGIAEFSPHADYLAITSMRVRGSYSVLDARVSTYDGWNEEEKRWQLTLGILNVGDSVYNAEIMVPKHCLAVGLEFNLGPQYYLGSAYKIPTTAPIAFTLDKRTSLSGSDTNNYYKWNDCYSIKRSELVTHGMELVTLYL